MPIQRFQQLRVYAAAVDLRRQVFELSKPWPVEERYALTDQVRRSSRAIGANIAEAWSKRRYQRHFVSKLTDAHAEAAETQVWLDVALECEYLPAHAHEQMLQCADAVQGMLVRMMQQAERWCGPAALVREDQAPYDVD